MKFSRRQFMHLTAGAASLAGLARAARAEAYPTHAIKLVIPYPPGGVNDAVGRPWADKVKARLGTVVVANVGGAGGSLGAGMVARAKPDGYTILLGNTGTQVIHPLAAIHPAYDALESFDPISILGFAAVAITVHPSVPAHNLKDFIEYAR